MIFVNSTSLSKIRRAAGTCYSLLTKRCAVRRRAKVAVDTGQCRQTQFIAYTTDKTRSHTSNMANALC